MVASISQNGIAFRDGSLRVGDVIDSVNGQQLRGAELPEVGYSVDQFLWFPIYRARDSIWISLV